MSHRLRPKEITSPLELKGLTAIAYCRVSTEMQDSFDSQEREIRAFAERHEIKILKVCCETGSGGGQEYETNTQKLLDKRPILKQIIAEINPSKWQILLVYHFDRLARNILFSEWLKNTLLKSGITPWSVSGSNEPLSRAVTNAVAEYNVGIIREKTRIGLDSLASRGYWVHVKPFGYNLKKTNHNARVNQSLAKLVVNEKEATMLKEIFKKYAAGEKLISISKEFKMSSPRILAMFRMQTYLGHTTHSGSIIKNTHVPLIDEETFNAVQERLKNNRTSKSTKMNKLIAELK